MASEASARGAGKAREGRKKGLEFRFCSPGWLPDPDFAILELGPRIFGTQRRREASFVARVSSGTYAGKAITENSHKDFSGEQREVYKSAAIPILKTLSSLITYPAASSPCSLR